MTERSPWRIAFEALAHRNGSASESVTLRMNAKGGTQPEIVAVPQEGETLEQAVERGRSLYDGLCKAYARVETPFGPERKEGDA